MPVIGPESQGLRLILFILNLVPVGGIMGAVDKIANIIPVRYTDSRINELTRSVDSDTVDLPRHYNQNEEFFLRLPREVEIPHIPIHHDIRRTKPSDDYLDALREVVGSLLPHIPGFFLETTYFFDPAEVLRPCFFQIFKIADETFLYLGRIDLTFRTHDGELIDRGSNDVTPRYRTRNIFLDCDLIPLEEVIVEENRITGFSLKQIVSQTWIGETGRGYFVQGIWIDHELTKFFSKLFIPSNVSLYPYYPFTCKYRSVCHSLIETSPAGRRRGVPRLRRALQFLEPEMESIQQQLKREPFNPEAAVFTTLKRQVGPVWRNAWRNIGFRRYLNSHDMKEFELVPAEA